MRSLSACSPTPEAVSHFLGFTISWARLLSSKEQLSSNLNKPRPLKPYVE
jgi:hypothetical protein